MKSRYDTLPDARSRWRLALLRSAVLAVLAAALFAGAFLLPPGDALPSHSTGRVGAVVARASDAVPMPIALARGIDPAADLRNPDAITGRGVRA
jgi:hypothetical protein